MLLLSPDWLLRSPRKTIRYMKMNRCNRDVVTVARLTLKVTKEECEIHENEQV